MGRAAEDRPGAIVHQNEVGHVDRQCRALDEGVAGGEPRVEAPLLGRLDRLLAGPQAIAFGDEGLELGVVPCQLGGQRMMGRDRHEGGAEQGVGTGREDLQRSVPALDAEVDPRPLRPSDPVPLHDPDPLGPAVQAVQRVEQLVGIGRDAKEPLAELAPFDHGARPPAAAVDHLLVGQNRMVHRIPVDPGFPAIDQAGIEQVEEQRLLVRVIALVAGGDLARPVDRQAHLLELGAHGRDVGIGPFGRVDLALHGRVLRRQAEGVPAHGMEHVVAARPLVTRDHVADRVVADVAHVDTARWIGEHLEHVVFRARRILGHGEASGLVPGLLPLGLGFLDVVAGHGFP